MPAAPGTVRARRPQDKAGNTYPGDKLCLTDACIDNGAAHVLDAPLSEFLPGTVDGVGMRWWLILFYCAWRGARAAICRSCAPVVAAGTAHRNHRRRRRRARLIPSSSPLLIPHTAPRQSCPSWRRCWA